ncbi:MAG: hypothetical protein IJA78_02070 [Clostridia bacterium]|nr:hypothetical protein [Clostridia bacterium]MBQ3482942.1 hypothetical protein [Clostridia bacterium]
MLKGCQREMIVLQTQDSALFEHAYFILRREKPTLPRGDMLAEANRIIGAGSGYFARRRHRGRGVLLFLLGFLLGAGIFLLLRALIGF